MTPVMQCLMLIAWVAVPLFLLAALPLWFDGRRHLAVAAALLGVGLAFVNAGLHVEVVEARAHEVVLESYTVEDVERKAVDRVSGIIFGWYVGGSAYEEVSYDFTVEGADGPGRIELDSDEVAFVDEPAAEPTLERVEMRTERKLSATFYGVELGSWDDVVVDHGSAEWRARIDSGKNAVREGGRR